MKSLIKPSAHSETEMSAYPTWRATFAADWKLIIIGTIATFFLASIFMSGLPDGLIPNLTTPYAYSDDGLFHAWMAQRVTEGWLFDNVRSGYPFGSSFRDFPGSDSGAHLLIKVFALMSGGWVGGVNLFFLFGFASCFVATYVTARAFSLNRSFAVAMSVLYAFASFHFFRLGHLFYTWYFVAPLFFYLALDIYLTRGPTYYTGLKSTLRKLVASAVGMLVLASFGVYYALFGVIILATAGVMNAIKTRSSHGAKKAALLISATILGVMLNIAPNVLGTYKDGPNPEMAQRSIVESEVYGLKMMQLLMPRADHRISQFREIAQKYQQTPLVNENATASLGIIGAAGFMMALFYLIFIPARTGSDDRLRLLAVTTFVLFLFATVGGLGSLFAMVISPLIRGWNRDSIFIACGALLFFFISLQLLLQKKAPRLANQSVAIAVVLLFVGMYDQTLPIRKNYNSPVKAWFDNDRDFVQSIEKALPAGGAVYQLPYIGFPETPIMHRLRSYQMMAGVLHSKDLHWSYGGTKGRPGDLFYRALAKEPMSHQIEVIRKLGFDGIYIDRRGYADNGEAIIKELSQLLQQPPLLQSDNKELVFYKLDNSAHPDLASLTAKQIQREAGYIADALGPRYSADLMSGIDFTRASWPDFIDDAQGLYGLEPWGRWSSQQAVFKFTDPLPQKFSLILNARAFGAQDHEPTLVRIGSREYRIPLTAGFSEIRLDVDLAGESADSITFIPPKAVSPKQLTGSSDSRILGIGFVSMRIIQ
ncbi:phosphoglycerol transferase I [Yersinia frederiksenii]|nr:phosphoglycerol transferase I [Yersinia frederiksenii]CNK99704.1 phosphoglycerol transferase I [Yersinia frederiksenii]CQJ01648.1 phosphoglycerol transferase I [Yersinia frederiksenii]